MLFVLPVEWYMFNHLYGTKNYSSAYYLIWFPFLLGWIYVFADILVPLDNYISKSTAHFLTCKDPDYQQSLWNMISSVSRILPRILAPDHLL